MTHIEVKKFGPIEDGFGNSPMPIAPVTIFCGNQGTGKSTIAKLISLFTWMEKAFMRGDYAVGDNTTSNDLLLKQHCSFHRIHNYFRPETEISYLGEKFNFYYHNGHFNIEPINSTQEYLMPTITYYPAERNILSVVEHPEALKEIPESLYNFYGKFDIARKDIKNGRQSPLPIDGYAYHYNPEKNTSWLVSNNCRVLLTEAASGFQSLIPLSLVARHMHYLVRSGKSTRVKSEQQQKISNRAAAILADDTISEEMRRLLISQLSESTKYRRTINIVEEPELNLYPTAQRNVLFSLFGHFNAEPGNRLVITTHSPYLIDYTTLAIKAHLIVSANPNHDSETESIVPSQSRLKANDVCIYQIEDGAINRLETFDGMPSDSNMLNRELENANELFAQLMEIES